MVEKEAQNVRVRDTDPDSDEEEAVFQYVVYYTTGLVVRVFDWDDIDTVNQRWKSALGKKPTTLRFPGKDSNDDQSTALVRADLVTHIEEYLGSDDDESTAPRILEDDSSDEEEDEELEDARASEPAIVPGFVDG